MLLEVQSIVVARFQFLEKMRMLLNWVKAHVRLFHGIDL